MEVMTKRMRKVLFFICTFSFLLAAPSILLYSQGYRLDLEQKRIVKTGAFYFKVVPKAAQIFVDGKLRKKTDFFFGSAFIENLLPQEYLVEVKKPEYQTWRKNLEIQEARVTEAKDIVLVPETAELDVLAKDIKAFFPSPSGQTIILKTIAQENENQGWRLKTFNPARKIESRLLDESDLSKNGAALLNITWSPDSGRIILETEIDKIITYFLLDLSKGEPFLKKIELEENISDLFFHPTYPQKLLFTKTSEEPTTEEENQKEKKSLALFEKDLDKDTTVLILEGSITYEIAQGQIFWISEDGFLQKSTLAGESQPLSQDPFSIKQEGDYSLKILNSQIFLQEDYSLFFFNQDTKKFEKIANNKIKSFILSPNTTKACFANEFEIWVFFLQEELSPPQREARSKLFLTRFSQKIENIFWLDDHYLIFTTGPEIKIIEIDDRDEIQIWNLATLENPEIYFNHVDKKLYILSQGNFFISEKLP